MRFSCERRILQSKSGVQGSVNLWGASGRSSLFNIRLLLEDQGNLRVNILQKHLADVRNSFV